MSQGDFEKLTKLVIDHEVLTKEAELLRQQITLYQEQVAALKEANTALRELANRQSAPFGIPLPTTPDWNARCMMCGAIGGHNGLPCPSTAPHSVQG